VTCLKESRLGAIVAKSFGRIYYRNCLNAALPALTCGEAVEVIQDGETIEIDLEGGILRCGKGAFTFPPLPSGVMEIFEAGGLVPFTRKRLEARKRSRDVQT
jgi:3-isopropylmalate/(R)-2-methylmalate dehydratase small subunit